jgi:hypothetical protein
MPVSLLAFLHMPAGTGGVEGQPTAHGPLSFLRYPGKREGILQLISPSLLDGTVTFWSPTAFGGPA